MSSTSTLTSTTTTRRTNNKKIKNNKKFIKSTSFEKQQQQTHKHKPTSLVLTRDQVSFEFRENYILKGYRAPNSSFLTCFKSVFKFNNNEMVNFWSHFIPFLLIFIYLLIFTYEYNVFNDNFMWPFFIYLSTSSFYLFMSSMAHALNCMSNIARHICFILDYLSISIYGMGCCIAYKAYSLSLMPHYTSIFFDYYVTIAMCVTIVSNIMASASRFVLSYNVRGLLRLGSVSAQYIFISLPLFYRLIISYIPNSNHYLSKCLKYLLLDDSGSNNTAAVNSDTELFMHNINHESNFYFVAQLLFAILSAFLYISHIPERYYPGRFDIIGQSHQIFHLSSAFATYLQIQALKSDMFQLRPILYDLLNSNHNSTSSPSSATYYQRNQFYTLYNHTTNTTNYLMQTITANHSEYRLNENLYKETHLLVNSSILANLTAAGTNQTILAQLTDSIPTITNFYTYSMKHIDFLTVTLSPYFRTKLTYAFIMLCCLLFNSMILIYYYLKALYFNPWTKLSEHDAQDFFKNYCNSCCFHDSYNSNSSTTTAKTSSKVTTNKRIDDTCGKKIVTNDVKNKKTN